MRKAFEQFMLTGGNASATDTAGGKTANSSTTSGKKKKKKRPSSASLTPPKVTPMKQNEKEESDAEYFQLKVTRQLKKMEREYWQIYRAFCGTLQREWLDIDDNLSEVLESIVHMRDRLFMESTLVSQKKENQVTLAWAGHGSSSFAWNHEPPAGGLMESDVNLALSHDLREHERLLVGVRSLLAALSDGHDTLGRRLEEMMLHHLESNGWLDDVVSCKEYEADETLIDTVSTSSNTCATLADDMCNVFHLLSMELYRKQMLAQEVLKSSASTSLLAQSRHPKNNTQYYLDAGDDDFGTSARKVASTCNNRWQRGSKNSYIDADRLHVLLLKSEKI